MTKDTCDPGGRIYAKKSGILLKNHQPQCKLQKIVTQFCRSLKTILFQQIRSKTDQVKKVVLLCRGK